MTLIKESAPPLRPSSTSKSTPKVASPGCHGSTSSTLAAKEPWIKALHDAGYKNVDGEATKPLMEYLEFCLEQVCADNELGGLLKALEGEYVLPGPGGDPIRNPDVLPTGKNIHALDPQSIPTTAAVQSAKVVVDRLLERQRLDNGGKYPETIATVLWGTDNIKTYGESLAQMLWFVGVKPGARFPRSGQQAGADSPGRVGTPPASISWSTAPAYSETCFINQMALLDRGVKMAAEADEPLEMNFVRKHAMEQAEEMGCTLRQAATRIFLQRLRLLRR